MEIIKSVNLCGIKPYIPYSTRKTGISTVYKGMGTYNDGDLLSGYELVYGREAAIKDFLSRVKNPHSLEKLEWLAVEHFLFSLGYRSVGISFTRNMDFAKEWAMERKDDLELETKRKDRCSSNPINRIECQSRATLIIAEIPNEYLISIVDVRRKRPEYFKARLPNEARTHEEDDMVFFGSLEKGCFEVHFLE